MVRKLDKEEEALTNKQLRNVDSSSHPFIKFTEAMAATTVDFKKLPTTCLEPALRTIFTLTRAIQAFAVIATEAPPALSKLAVKKAKDS